MSAPSKVIKPVDRYSGQAQLSVFAPAERVYFYDAGSDANYLDEVSNAFELLPATEGATGHATIVYVTAGGQTATEFVTTGRIYPQRIVQLKATGTTLNGCSLKIYC